MAAKLKKYRVVMQFFIMLSTSFTVAAMDVRDMPSTDAPFAYAPLQKIADDIKMLFDAREHFLRATRETLRSITDRRLLMQFIGEILEKSIGAAMLDPIILKQQIIQQLSTQLDCLAPRHKDYETSLREIDETMLMFDSVHPNPVSYDLAKHATFAPFLVSFALNVVENRDIITIAIEKTKHENLAIGLTYDIARGAYRAPARRRSTIFWARLGDDFLMNSLAEQILTASIEQLPPVFARMVTLFATTPIDKRKTFFKRLQQEIIDNLDENMKLLEDGLADVEINDEDRQDLARYRNRKELIVAKLSMHDSDDVVEIFIDMENGMHVNNWIVACLVNLQQSKEELVFYDEQALTPEQSDDEQESPVTTTTAAEPLPPMRTDETSSEEIRPPAQKNRPHGKSKKRRPQKANLVTTTAAPVKPKSINPRAAEKLAGLKGDALILHQALSSRTNLHKTYTFNDLCKIVHGLDGKPFVGSGKGSHFTFKIEGVGAVYLVLANGKGHDRATLTGDYVRLFIKRLVELELMAP